MSSPMSAPTRVSNLELFFDLVFVFTITQLTTVIVQEPTPLGLARAALVLLLISWMYGGYAWLTNAEKQHSNQSRVLLLAGMAGFFVCAIAVPQAFNGSGAIFGAGYVLVTLIHTVGFLLQPGNTDIGAVYRLAPWNFLSAGLVLAGGFCSNPSTWGFWLAASAVQQITPTVSRFGRETGFRLNAEHFAERHGLMILIVLGESLVSVGLAADHRFVAPGTVAGMLAGLAATAALWWAYFVDDDTLAAEAFGRATPERRTFQALYGYGLAHYTMIMGLVILAAGTKLAVAALTSPTRLFAAFLIAAGPASFMAGSAAFRGVLGYARPTGRLLCALLCLAVAPAGFYGSAALELATIAVLLACALAVDGRGERFG
jgi:low temperature requirement protein LtrA